MLGGKALPCFLYSALHDDDAEFLRRYGHPERAPWMLRHYANTPTARHACQRLTSLL